MRPARKRKLTLTVDNEVVEKAKEIGLNLSDITEKVLRGFAFAPSEGTKAEVYTKYKELFTTMKPILAEYGTSVEIARYADEDEQLGLVEEGVYLTPGGQFWNDRYEDRFSDIEKVPLFLLHEPKQILTNFIQSLSEEKLKRRERLGELEMAKRIILAMSDTLASTERPSKGVKK